MRITILIFCAFFFFQSSNAQPKKAVQKPDKNIREESEKEDIKYELKHKNQAWFKSMNKSGADYFVVKNAYDKYFANHKWEDSKTRELGASWIKTKIFYLDKNGKVQDEPAFDDSRFAANKTNFGPSGVTATTRTVGSWTMIGPVNSATTGYSGSGNHGGYVYLNRLDPTNTNKMFAAFLTGGLWVTTDGGTNWTLTDTNMPDEIYNDIDVCTGTPSVVYAMQKNRVIKSTDGGMTWANTTLMSGSYTGTAYDIAVAPNNPNIVVARWSDKIYRTTDGGTTWSAIVTGLPNYSIWDCSNHSEMLDWSTTDNNVVYCLSFSTSSNTNQVVVYKSSDAGASFSAFRTITLDPTANGQVVGWAKLLFSTANSSQFYVAIGTGLNAYAHKAVQLYKLNNSDGTNNLMRVNMLTGLTDPTGIHHGDITMDRVNESKLAYGTYLPNNIYYSSNNGVSFAASAATTHSDVRSIDMVNGKIIIGSDGEAAVTTNNGTTITTVTNSISNHELWGFGSAFKSDIVAIGANHGPVMIKENGSGFEWYNGTGADQGNTDVNPLDDRYIYSQGYSNYRYFRTGVHTLINESNMLDAGGIYDYFNSMEFHPNLYYSLVTHHAGGYPAGNPNLTTWRNSIIRTDDNGASIYIVKTFGAKVFREKICMTNPNVMYVVVGLTNNAVWKTTDGGANWTNVTPTSGESSGQTNISDIAVSDVDPNQVWITYSGVQSTCKVLKSSNGGGAWTNLTDPILSSNPNTKIIFQRGSNGGVYVGNKSGIYYRNNSMPNWVLLGTGLPTLDVRFMFINYNQGKLKIGTSRGAWEHNLYEISPPKAQISASTNKVVCSSFDQVQFKDYSTVRNTSATWAWSFPGGTPSTSSAENPLVSYAGAANGSYNVSLTVTDAYGTSTQTLSNFIQVDGTDCAVDTVAGKVLTLTNPGDYAQQSAPLNITTNTITLSCWIKPNGTQVANAGIIFSANNGATGLSYDGSGRLGYTWNDEGGTYGYNSGLAIPVNVWSHVAMVITPTTSSLYLNGVAVTRSYTHTAINFNQAFLMGMDRYTSRTFKGLMDEVCIYNRALSTNEIRELMNLTRNNPNAGSLPGNDASLISYYQFNEGPGKPAYDKTGGRHASLAGTADKSALSTAPVGGGTFQRINVTTGGTKNFTAPGVEITFPGSGNKPNGDVIVTRINTQSDEPASQFTLPSNPNAYFVIRNYGTNSTFAALTSMKFNNIKGTNAVMVSTPSALKLYKRQSNDFGLSWGSSIDNADVVTSTGGTGTVLFSTGLNNTSFSQYAIGVDPSVLPVQLLSFTAKAVDNKKISLAWAVAQELGLQGYEIERSTDGGTYVSIGFVAASGKDKYAFDDLTPESGRNYYRIKAVDFGGQFKYSETRNADIKSGIKLIVSPNPTSTGRVAFKLQGIKNNTGLSLSVTNASGQMVNSLTLSNITNNAQYLLDIGKPGIYFLHITLTNGDQFSQKIAVIK